MERNNNYFFFSFLYRQNLILLLFLFFICSISFGQTIDKKYWIQFADKNGTPYSVSNPSAFLSPRAIERRTKQNIPVIQNDLPLTPAYIASVLSIDSVFLLNTSKWFNAITVNITDTNKLSQIRALPCVAGAVPVNTIKWKNDLENILGDNTGSFNKTTINQPTVYNYGSSFNQVNMIDIDCMHNQGYDGKSMVIAVLDAGFDHADVLNVFDSLRTHNQILGTWDFVTGNAAVYEDFSHGMSVLSAMGGNSPGQLIGTAPKASYWLLRTEEVASENIIEEDNWVAAAEYADSVGADIINSSLGYTTFDNSTQNHTYAQMDGNTARITIGADIAAGKGIFVTNSAGNSGNDAWHYIDAPADGDSVCSVGAVDANRNYVSFSSKGPTYDGRIKPNIAAQGSGTFVTYPSGAVAPANGTSFSSPLIAGAVACLWQANPYATNMQLLDAIQKSADKKNSPDNFTGYGIPNFCIANELLSGVSPTKFNDENIFNLFPNPFTDSFQLSYYADNAQTITMDFFDVTGRLLLSQQETLKPNSYNIYSVNSLQYLQTGVYILKITTPDKKHVVKVVKK